MDYTVVSLPAYLVYHMYMLHVCEQLLEINRYSTTHALLLHENLFMHPLKNHIINLFVEATNGQNGTAPSIETCRYALII